MVLMLVLLVMLNSGKVVVTDPHIFLNIKRVGHEQIEKMLTFQLI